MTYTEQKMRFYLPFIVYALLPAIIDFYLARFIRLQFTGTSGTTLRRSLHAINLLTFVITIAGLAYIFANKPDSESVGYFQRIFLFLSLVLSIYLPKIILVIFLMIHDIVWLGLKLMNQEQRLRRVRKIILRISLIPGIIILILSLYGISYGKFRFETRRETVVSDKLPESFKGYKVVQLSDFHIGCYLGHEDKLREIVDIVNDLKPDLLVFTGDMVNNSAEELRPFIPILQELRAKDGKFAIQGNHDYGNYSQWETPEAKQRNLDALLGGIREAGFELLHNEHREILREGKKINLIGVENYGKPPFPTYGDLGKAVAGADTTAFSILLSHDPSHWDMQVLGTFIDLTLSGHTHGMQAGIECCGLRWSPAQYKYPRWAGLYQEGDQYLYVNRGIGFMGFSGRIGIWPEISILDLY